MPTYLTNALLGLLPLVTKGFQPTGVTTVTTTSLNAEKSAAIPFLNRPEKLDGSMIGDVGFDPFLISDTLEDLHYARTAELKNGRVAMMACTGFFVEELFHLPGPGYDNPDPLGAIFTVPLAANVQILLACAVVELATLDITYGEGEPGDYGWDPALVLFGRSDEYIKDMKLKELTHCRTFMSRLFHLLLRSCHDGLPRHVRPAPHLRDAAYRLLQFLKNSLDLLVWNDDLKQKQDHMPIV